MPSNSIVPALGVINPRIIRPSVLFPDPDSPTMDRVSPRSMVSDTPSTATKGSLRRLPV
jgi:hypothetical protein